MLTHEDVVSPARKTVSSKRDVRASPKPWICDTARFCMSAKSKKDLSADIPVKHLVLNDFKFRMQETDFVSQLLNRLD